MPRKSGKWICFTGIDGVGKTTLCQYTLQLLKKSKFMKIPYFDWVREMMQLSGKNTPYGDKQTDMLIFSAGNRLEMYLLEKWIHENDFVITQRCWLDHFPYRSCQGFRLKESMHFLQPERFRKPDIIFFLDCDYRTAYNRIKDKRGDKYESPYFMKKLEKEFKNMFFLLKKGTFPVCIDRKKIITLDATRSLDELKEDVCYHLRKLRIYCSGP